MRLVRSEPTKLFCCFRPCSVFPQCYVKELMSIEASARRHVSNAIEFEKQLTSIEIREKLKGKILVNCEDYIQLKIKVLFGDGGHILAKICQILSQINAVANVDGSGRDDLGHEILTEAEGISRRITKEQSKAVRNLAESIKRK